MQTATHHRISQNTSNGSSYTPLNPYCPHAARVRPKPTGETRVNVDFEARIHNSAYYGNCISVITDERRRWWATDIVNQLGFAHIGRMAEQLSRIPARSRREAMDWSLVLASQDIETTIDCTPEETDWGLVVAPQDYQRAREAVELYRAENRHWAWRKQVLRGGLLFDWTSLLWVLLLCLFYALADDRRPLRDFGLMDGAAVSHGEYWRLFTAMWLHADLGHLASNAALGIVLLGLTMGRYGSGLGLLGAYLAGVGGNLAVWVLAFGHASLGASGLVMGCLGLLAAGTFLWERRRPRATKYLARGILAGALLFVLFGLSPESDVRAHIGGFISGVLIGILLNTWPIVTRNERLNLLGGCLFAALVIVPWGIVFAKL